MPTVERINMPEENEAPSPPWMDKKLLELWLKPHHGEVSVTDVESNVATSKGDNYLSVIHRLVVHTKEGQSYSLLVKCRLEDGDAANIMRESAIFKKEQEMYGVTLPKMSALLKKALPDSFEPLAPRCYYACKSFLVLEDMMTQGFRMCDRLQGLDLQQSLQAVRTVARFHASSLALLEQDPGCMDEYAVSFFTEPCLLSAWDKCFTGMAKTLREELETWPQEEWGEYVQKMRQVEQNVMQRLGKTVARNEKGPNVLVHGDFWINNIIFDDANRVRLLDFQLVNYTSPVLDLHLFLCTSANFDVRVHHTDTLLQEYHRVLCSTLTALEYSKPLMTLQEVHEEFDRKSSHGVWAMIGPAACMLTEPDNGFDLDKALMTGEIPGPSMYNDYYRTVLKWMLPVLDKKGAFNNP
ncbi:uncharacterized protein [Periplaneta americana]|uniref:uncharacterized protein isoform X2 n=1 Tax=Periplaneta americana TaxID=6978 RepID=UPI0037E92536